MKRLKEKKLEDSRLATPSSTDRSTPFTPSSTGDPMPPTPSHTTRPNDTYVYDVGILAVVATGVFVLFTHNTFQPKNKKLIHEKKDEPPKRRHML